MKRSGRREVCDAPLDSALGSSWSLRCSVACDRDLRACRRRAARDPEAMPFAPRRYVCYRASSAPSIDGKLDEAAWRAAPWTDDFIDIEGDIRPRPRFRTRAKMLWDDTNFYVALDMEEPDLWGTLTERDAIIYNDNDVEVFIDPDGDTHNYYELEVNPLGTIFDLMLIQPYRDGGPPIIAWDIAGLQLAHRRPRHAEPARAIATRGGPSKWRSPGASLREAAPGKRPPKAGEQWRVNFSRVEWQLECEGRPLRQADRSGNGQAGAGGQLGVERAGRDRHAHARAVGLRPVLRHPVRRRHRVVRRRSQRAGEVGAPPALLPPAPFPGRARALCLGPGRAGCGQYPGGGDRVPAGSCRRPPTCIRSAPRASAARSLWIRQDGKTWVTR